VTRRPALAALGGLLLFVLILFWRAAFGGEAIYERDTGFWYYPQLESIVRIVTSGSWPFWDPYMSFGVPLLGNPSAQILYPPIVFNLLFEPWTFYTWYVVGHLVFSGMGQYLLARRLGLSPLASFLAAAAWTASGPLLSVVNMWHHFSGAAWIPWVFLAAEHACDVRTLRAALAWGLVQAGQILTGSADMCAIATLPAMVCASRRLRWSSPTAPENRRWLATVGVAWLAAVCLTAGQWLPSVELLPASSRLSLPPEGRTYWSVHPLALLQLLTPTTTMGLRLAGSDELLRTEIERPLLDSLYLGVPVLGLAALGALGQRRTLRRFLVVLAIATLLVALGRHAPFYSLLVAFVPPLSIVRYPVKVTLLAPLACGLLAGMGLDELRLWSERARRTVVVATGWLVLLALACAALSWLATAGPERWPFRLFAPTFAMPAVLEGVAQRGLGAALAGLFAAALLWRGRSSWAPPALAALCATELAWAHRDVNPTAPISRFRGRPETVAALRQDGARAPARLYSWDYTTRVRGSRFPDPRLYDALNDPSWQGPASLGQILAYRTLYPASGRWELEGSFDRDILGLSPGYLRDFIVAFQASLQTPHYPRMFALASVDYVLALHGEGLEALTPVASVPSLFPTPILLFRVPDPIPFAHAVGRARILEPGTFYRPLVDPAFDPRREVLLVEGAPLSAESFSGVVETLERKADRIRVAVDFSSDGYLVLNGTYDAGWRTTIDGRPAPQSRANVAFRAVRVPAGRHVVEQTYRPWGALIGLPVTALSLALVVFLLVRGFRAPNGP
jgi:hypothetical protein